MFKKKGIDNLSEKLKALYSIAFLYLTFFIMEIGERFFNIPVSKSSVYIFFMMNVGMMCLMFVGMSKLMSGEFADMKEKIKNVNDYYDELELKEKETKKQ